MIDAVIYISLLALLLGLCQFTLLRKWFLCYALRLHSLHDCFFSCRYGTFNLTLLFFAWRVILLDHFSGRCLEGEGTLNTLGDARSSFLHSCDNAVFIFLLFLLLFIFVRVWLACFRHTCFVFAPFFVHLALCKFLFGHFTGSVFQRKSMYVCLVLLHLLDIDLLLILKFVIVEVYNHWLARRF